MAPHGRLRSASKASASRHEELVARQSSGWTACFLPLRRESASAGVTCASAGGEPPMGFGREGRDCPHCHAVTALVLCSAKPLRPTAWLVFLLALCSYVLVQALLARPL